MPRTTTATPATSDQSFVSRSVRLTPALIDAITKAITSKNYFRDDCEDLINQSIMHYLESGDATLNDEQIVRYCTSFVRGEVSNLREKKRLWNEHVRNPAEDKDKSRRARNELTAIPASYRNTILIEENVADNNASPEDTTIHFSNLQRVDQIKSTLTLTDQRNINMYSVCDSRKEAAQALGVSESLIGKSIKRLQAAWFKAEGGAL